MTYKTLYLWICFFDPQTFLQTALDTTVTSASWTVGAGKEESHPVAVAVCPVYKGEVEAGRQIGATEEEKRRGVTRVRMEKSYSRLCWS